MPPGKPLSKEVVADFAVWIQQGAVWPNAARLGNAQTHWAFQPVRPIQPPRPKGGDSGHVIDCFVASRRDSKGLQRMPQAKPGVLLRRLYFDLIGLPPTSADLSRFRTASRQQPELAFKLEVERLLSSPRYGERWGRHWLDVARYADTAGDNADYPIPEARLYRDYVIQSFNDDLPFDQFVREQVAGDIIAKQAAERDGKNPRHDQQIVATGFLALSRRYGTAPYELWHLTLEDTLDTFGRAFMGLTLKCARCHDHKFDPITTRDYYRLYGIFDSTQYPWAGGEEFQSKKLPRQHFVPLGPAERVIPQLKAFAQTTSLLRSRIEQLETKLKGTRDSKRPGIQKQLAADRNRLVQLEKRGLPSGLQAAYAVAERSPHDVPIHVYGEPGTSSKPVPRGAVQFLCKEPLRIPEHQSGRLQLANWLTAGEHPLTARVIVNRIWQHHFGRGIVATPSNFGLSGAAPTHRDLLDYLAGRFVAEGWSIKWLHRFILTSKTWQLSSERQPDNFARDPENGFYWRHSRRRLDAESIRDALLQVSGDLDLTRPKEHPFPPISKWHWTQHHPFKERYESHHRSVYLMTQRIQKHPFLALFDGPDANKTIGKRTSATATPQSLYLMNSVEMKTVSSRLADRLIRSSPSRDGRIALAFRLCFARDASEQEITKGRRYIDAFLQQLSADPAKAMRNRRDAWSSYSRILLSSNEFFYID